MDKMSVGILIFDNVEVLDFAGPYEVFSRTRTVAGTNSRRTDDSAPFHVFTVAENPAPVKAVGGLTVTSDYSFDSAPPIDLLLVPGGMGSRPLLEDQHTLRWIDQAAANARHVTSVCTGALLFAKLGLLNGRRATTHWGALELLASLGTDIEVDADSRYVDDGIVTSAGVSAGIDMSFYMVEKLCGPQVADETAHYIDYPRRTA